MIHTLCELGSESSLCHSFDDMKAHYSYSDEQEKRQKLQGK